jgi:hypothetical protein
MTGVISPIEDYIKKALTEMRPDTTEICVKIGLDNCWITGSQQSESGTVQLIWDGLKLNETMSSENVHQWMLYLGPELYDSLKEEMGDQLKFINELADKMSEKRTVRNFQEFSENFPRIFREFSKIFSRC